MNFDLGIFILDEKGTYYGNMTSFTGEMNQQIHFLWLNLLKRLQKAYMQKPCPFEQPRDAIKENPLCEFIFL